MEKLNIILSDGVEKEVDCMFYLYNSKYYYIYTEKEIDENGYVILYLSQVGKEIKNTPNGPIETGYMVGVEINDEEEWKDVQSSIAKIVEDAKNGTTSQEIQYIPLSMLSKLKIVSKKTFRLMKEIVINNLHVDIINEQTIEPVVSVVEQPQVQQGLEPIVPETSVPTLEPQSIQGSTQPTPVVFPVAPSDSVVDMTQSSIFNNNQENDVQIQDSVQTGAIAEEDNTVIIDYRAKFFEEQEKNAQLQQQLDELNQKIEQVKNILN